MRIRLRVLPWFLLAPALACATNPVSGRREIALVSEAQEIQMGREGAAEVAASIGLLSDADLQTWVNAIGQTVAAKTERPGLPWEFKVVDDAAVNAFALPGGFIFVTRGMLSKMTSEAELASVLGHEAGHVAARHSVQQMSRSQLATLGLGLGSVLSPTIAKYGDVAGAGLGLLFLKYSRDDETQADQLGFRYALADNYDTREMVSMFEMLQRESALAGGGRLPEWQSTHPDPGNRIEATQRLVRESGRDFASTRVGGAEFLKRIDGLAYGTDPRLGFFQESRFVHPELAFTMLFPEGWTYRNAADAVTAVSKEQDAIVELRAAKGTTSEATKAFFAQPGVQAGTESRGDVHGNFVIKSNFTAQSSGGEAVGGAVQFINFNGSTWAITAYTAANRVATQTRAFERSFASFSRLADASALAVQPFRIKIAQAPRAMSLQQFNNEFPSAIPLAELAMINGMTEATMLRSGQSVKRVLGTPVPQVIVSR